MGTKNYSIDMCNGPLLRQIIVFALPLMGSTILQVAFNAADYMVVGRFASHQALAAVGATGALTNVLVNLFVGISMGANVVAAQAFGAKEWQKVSQSVHTSAVLSFIIGCFLAVLGVFVSRPLLSLMKTPADIIDQATLYMQIYFGGMPFVMAYNFGSAVLRAAGDTRRPLYYLLIAGILNVVLNMFFVIVLHRDVDGVAVATVVSQALSAFLVWRAVAQTQELGGLHPGLMKITWRTLKQILAFGIPTGLQSCSFAVANTIIQSSINSFGSACVAGNTAATSVEGIVGSASNGVHYSSLSFSGQLYGGRKLDRLKKSVLYGILLGVISTLIIGGITIWARYPILSLFTSDAEVMDWGVQRMILMNGTYFIHAAMQVYSGTLRGLGRSFHAFLIVLVFACIYRIAWIVWVFPMHPTLQMLLVSFPISWIFVSIICGIYFHKLLKRMSVQFEQEGK